MARITVHTAQTAPEAARARVETAEKNNGFLPNLIGVLANAPQALAMYQDVGTLNAQTSLTAGEREIVQLVAAVNNHCGFCKAGHTALSLKKKLLAEDAVEAVRNGQSLADEKLNTLAVFATEALKQKGNVSDETLQAFFQAGYSEQQALEVILGLALATLCNYANNLARTDINPELQAYA